MLLCAVFSLALLGTISAAEEQTFGLDFLRHYGYISTSRSGNHDVGKAVRKFQKFFRLRVTGSLDTETLALMHKPRCGVSDVTDSGRVRRYHAASRWSKKHLTYYVQHGQDLGHALQESIFADALDYWARVSGLSFGQVNDPYSADIKISFGRYWHGGVAGEGGCGSPFNGPGGVLAHAYYPPDGRAHFDEDESYTHNTASGTNLLWVATHEFGHSLGLGHSNVRDAVMYPYYTGYVPNMQLKADDIAGIQYLYGPNTGGGGATPTPGVTNAPVPPTTSPSGNCFDRMDRSCQPYKDAGYCQQYPDNMKYWCQKTCNYC